MFVLGYRAKKMRQSKLSELIHVSETMPGLEYCSVQVHLHRIIDHAPPVGSSNEGDTASHYTIVPNSGLVVARTAYRNNRNVYTINDAPATYTDVTALLKGEGIDLDHKRFLILQGEVEAIAMMKPKGATEHEEGLLEYLEDIIGSNRYIGLIATAAKDLEASNELYAEKFVVVRAAEKEVGALRSERDEAEAFLHQENALTEAKSKVLQASRWAAAKERDECKQKAAESLEELTAMRHQHAADALLADEMEAAIKASGREMAQIERSLKKTQADLAALEQQDVKLQETRKHLKSRQKALAKASGDTQRQQGELARSIENLTGDIDRLTGEVQEKADQLASEGGDLDKISASLKGVTAKYQAELEAHQQALTPIQDNIRTHQKRLDTAKGTLADLEGCASASQRERAKISARIAEASREVEAAREKAAAFMSERAISVEKSAAIRGEIADLEGMRNRLSGEIGILQLTISEAMATINQGEHASAVHRALLKQSKTGAIKGIHGRLGDLGTIAPEYDAAIATACTYLDHVVVESTQVGQQCIEFLRKTNAGRANFIVLEKMRPAPPQGATPREMPQGARRLYDLVRVKDERFLSAMYFALRDTLVAATLGDAQRWAYGAHRWRTVTLDGKLFETSGTISGGGQVRRGGMSSEFKGEGVSEDQVRMLNERCAELQAQLKALIPTISKKGVALADSEDRTIKCEAELSLLERTLEALPVELEMLHQNGAKVDAQLSALAAQSESSPQAAIELQAEIEAATRAISECHRQRMPIEGDIKRVQQHILDAGGVKYKAQVSKVDGIREQIGHLESHLSKLESERAAMRGRLASLQEGGSDNSRMEAIEEELARNGTLIQDATASAVALQATIASLACDLDAADDRMRAAREAFDGANKSIARFRKAEYDLRCAIERLEERTKEAAAAIEQCTANLSELALHHIEALLAGGTVIAHAMPSPPPPLLAIYEDEADLAELHGSLDSLKASIGTISERLRGLHPNVKVLRTFAEKEAAAKELRKELEALDERRAATRQAYEEHRRGRFDEFMAGFRAISAKLKELYQLITMGGNAELELVDSLDPFGEGILFSVMPPRKSWKNIANLSGGEKTLSSLALVFALHTYRPTPIYVMDEIDAALDFRNVSIIAAYIRERTLNAQFIVISLRNNMFELADRLVGIYKTHQRTKSISIDPRAYAASLRRRATGQEHEDGPPRQAQQGA